MLFLAAVHILIMFVSARWLIRGTADNTMHYHGWISLALKLLAGTGLGLLYMYYYNTGDTIQFHVWGSELAEVARKDFGSYFRILTGLERPPHSDELLRAPRLFFMIKVVSFLHLLTGNNYWISGAYLSFFCWAGLFLSAVAIAGNYPVKRILVLLSLLYMPSVIFWASGLTKESIAMGAFGLFISVVIPHHRWRVRDVVLLVLSGLVLWMIKYYYLVPVILAVLLFYSLQWTGRKNWSLFMRAVPFAAILIIAGFGIKFLNPNLDPEIFPRVVYENYQVFLEKSDPGDAVILDDHCGSWKCLLYSFPEAVWAALFRPYMWESSQVFKILAGMENFILLLMFFYFIYSLRFSGQWNYRIWAFVLAASLFVITIGGFLGLAAPNFGTLSRYRVIIVPVMVLLFLINLPVNDLTNRIRRISKRSS